MKKRTTFLLMFVVCFSLFANSEDLVEFDKEEDRSRYQNLIFELRCPKCQNQNLADSNSQISIDLRAEVVRLIKEGKTDDEIKRFMVSRYGDFVLYEPPVQKNTLILWWAPVVMVCVGLGVFFVIVVRRSRSNTVNLEAEEVEPESEVS